MLSAFWAEVGAQLRRPEGAAGHLAGHAMWLANARANRLAVKALAPGSGEHVVELGCGPGHALRDILTQEVARVTGIDHSAVMIAQAARRNAPAVAAGRLALEHGDFAHLPFGNASIDAVLAVNVAYFMLDAAALGEARRVLKPGGRLVLYATRASSMRNWHFVRPQSHRLFEAEDLSALLMTAGFEPHAIHIQAAQAGFGVTGLIAAAWRSRLCQVRVYPE
jgi:ubiquinone/menaquinone biosynthesis C-methylase UbiE